MKNRKRNDGWKNIKNKRSRTPSTAIVENQKNVSVDEQAAEVKQHEL